MAARASAWFAPNRRVHRLRAGGYGGSLQTDGSTGSAPAATGLLLIAALLAGGGCALGAEDYALGVDGVYKGNVVVSDADADRVLAEDRSAKFLAKMNVAILK